MSDDIWQLVFLVGIAAIIYARIRLRKTKRIFITDYQRGIRYEMGAFAGVVGPGSYNCYSPKEQIIVVDMRPQPFVIERLLYRDALQAPSVISIGAELNVADPFLACTSLKDQVNDAVAIVREALRATVSRSIADTVTGMNSKIGDEIVAAANADLDKFGIRLSNLEITEAWSQPVQPRATAGAN